MEGKWSSLAGCRLLVRYFAREDALSQKDFADRLGVGEGTVYFWKVGFRRPGREFRPAIERITGIRASAWLTEAERAKEKRLSAA